MVRANRCHFWKGAYVLLQGATASGAKGNESFANVARSKYMPDVRALRFATPRSLTVAQPSSIQYEGVYFNFMLRTGCEREAYFAPAFSAGLCRDPITNQDEYWLSVGLNSKLDGKGLQEHGGRRDVNLVIVLDVSGRYSGPRRSVQTIRRSLLHSMHETFGAGDDRSTKMEVAKSAIITGLLPQLRPTDRVSIITFNTKANVLWPLREVRDIQTDQLKNAVSSMQVFFSTSFVFLRCSDTS